MQSPRAERHWHDLSDDEQIALRVAFGHHLDGLPATCSMETKVERFQSWLAARGIHYPGDGSTPAGAGCE
jgi:hypothetical protein